MLKNFVGLCCSICCENVRHDDAPTWEELTDAERFAELIWSFLSRSHLYARPGGLGKPVFRLILGSAWGISFLNYYWFYKMCRGAFKVLRRKTPASSREPSTHVDQPQNGGSVAAASSPHSLPQPRRKEL